MEPEENVTRAYTVISLSSFEVLEDKRVKFTSFVQNDFNLVGAMGKIGAAAALNQMPKSLKNWYALIT